MQVASPGSRTSSSSRTSGSRLGLVVDRHHDRQLDGVPFDPVINSTLPVLVTGALAVEDPQRIARNA